MAEQRRRRPSAAMIVALTALVFALAGTAIAGVEALSGKKVRKIAAKKANLAITKRAPGLSVAHAQAAVNAQNAQNADKLDGLDAAELRPRCPAATIAYAGTCIDSGSRPASNWKTAAKACGDAGGRLPSYSELEGFRQLPEVALSGDHWTDAIYFDGGLKALSITDASGSSSEELSVAIAFRCAFPLR